jgi:segregation and condensation protein A
VYKIKLQQFEGPLDLLLFFIKRDELDIYDIPISRITKEFMEYLNLLEQLDLEIAGDFILMASTLMQIKVRMLLPKDIDESGDEIDPRTDLIKALLEYKRYKEMSEEFSYLEANQRRRNFRGNYEADHKENPPELNSLLKNITLYDLIKVFKTVIEEKPKEAVHEVQRFNVSIEDQIDFIQNMIEKSNEIHFLDLIKGMEEKIKIIVTFIALLELIKMGGIGLKESEMFNDFLIYGISNGEDL